MPLSSPFPILPGAADPLNIDITSGVMRRLHLVLLLPPKLFGERKGAAKIPQRFLQPFSSLRVLQRWQPRERRLPSGIPTF
jgi:hypothetical protein